MTRVFEIASLACAVALAPACSRAHHASASSPHVLEEKQDANSISPSGARADAGQEQRTSTLPGAPASGLSSANPRREVWAGQLHSSAGPVDVCDGSLTEAGHGAMTTDAAIDHVVLEFEAGEDGAVLGQIQLGEGVLPDDPGILPLAGPGSLTPPPGPISSADFWICSTQLPARGGRYTLLDAFRSATRLNFNISPNEIWDGWCRRDKPACDSKIALCEIYPTCVCDGENGGCVADMRYRQSFDLVITGDTIEGKLWSDTELRLKRAE